MVEQQQKLVLSPYMDIYELVIPKDNLPKSRYNQKTPRQALLEQSKKLQRAVYETDESMKEQFQAKNTEDSLEKELEYCHAE